MRDLRQKARQGWRDALRLMEQGRGNVFFDPDRPRRKGADHGVLATLAAIDALPRPTAAEGLRRGA